MVSFNYLECGLLLLNKTKFSYIRAEIIVVLKTPSYTTLWVFVYEYMDMPKRNYIFILNSIFRSVFWTG